MGFGFTINHRSGLARTGVIETPHGKIKTPAFIPVGTQATLKALSPEQLSATGAQAMLVNAYHLYLRPGPEIIEAGGGVGKFMNWSLPTFSDSGGFQIMSLGTGFKKIIDMAGEDIDIPAAQRERLARIDDDGVTFKSHIDGSQRRFTPEISMKVQHQVGADIIFAFDELTTLHDSHDYQRESLDKRTHPWAERSLAAHKKLSATARGKPYQALYGVIQGAQFEDLRRDSARFLGCLDFDGYGLGGALTKHQMGEIVRWMVEELPAEKPRHMLGISEPDDIFACIENGADTFDCVSPARVARNGALYLPTGRINITNQKFTKDLEPLDPDCGCYTCRNYTRAYLNHLFRARELFANTLATIHNEYFIVRLVDDIRENIASGNLKSFKHRWLKKYYTSNNIP